MARTSAVVWGIVSLVVVIIAVLAGIYGPGLYSEGKALVGPIVELAGTEDRLGELDDRMPFDIPADGAVPEDRFQVFLEIRRELLPRYLAWQAFEQGLQETGSEDWKSAREALGEVRTMALAQRTALETHHMSPAEFNWIEDLVYGTWAKAAATSDEDRAAAAAIRRTTSDDLALLGELEGRYGATAATRELREHLDDRLEAVSSPAVPSVDGISDDNARLFWDHRDDIAELDLARYSELHELLRGSDDVRVVVGER